MKTFKEFSGPGLKITKKQGTQTNHHFSIGKHKVTVAYMNKRKLFGKNIITNVPHQHHVCFAVNGDFMKTHVSKGIDPISVARAVGTSLHKFIRDNPRTKKLSFYAFNPEYNHVYETASKAIAERTGGRYSRTIGDKQYNKFNAHLKDTPFHHITYPLSTRMKRAAASGIDKVKGLFNGRK